MEEVRVAVAELTETTFDLDVRGLAAGGSGIGALPDGRVVFVPRTAPGDRVRIRLVRSKKTWAEGTVAELLEPSLDRRPSLCSLFAVCGGCTLQHVPEAVQETWKGRFVADALTRIGGFEGMVAPPVTSSPRATGYRNRMTFTLRRLRQGTVVAGLHALGRPGHVVDVAGQCVLPESALRSAWVALRAGWGKGAALLPSGGALRLTLRSAEGGVVLIVEGGSDGWDAGGLAARVPQLVAIWHRPRDREARLVSGTVVDEDWGGERRPVVADSFTQVNREVAVLLEELVLARVGEGSTAVDAYCGAGRYGRTLARMGWSVDAIELDAAACAAARRSAPDGLRVLEARVEHVLGELLPVDLLILNPPRSGLAAGLPQIILGAPPRRIVYVSCDAATLARDLAPLRGCYDLEEVHAFDLFPQTAHVETVVVLERR